MKIVFVITGLKARGAEMMLFRLLERLDRRFSPHVISLTTLDQIGPRIKSLGIPVEALGMSFGPASPVAFIRLVSRLRAIGPDLVHTWLYHADLLGGLAAWLTGVPRVVWTIRHGNLDRDKNKRSTLAVVWSCARISSWVPAKIVSNSERARRVHIDHGYAAEKIVVIPNGFDLSSFHPDDAARNSVRAELKLAPRTPLVGLIGRFHPQKNVEGFFEAARELNRRLPEVHYLLAGEGMEPGNPAMAQAMKISRLRGVTHLLSSRNDVPHLMAAIDVLASSSAGEAFSNVLGEAMSCGIPCAVTDVGDSAYLVGDTGRIVPPDDMSALAAKLEELLTLSPEERTALGHRARERIAEHFEIGKVVKQYEVFYDDMAASLV